jgi:hypothetical protein
MNNENYWTGLADFTIGDMPPNAIGIIARVVTLGKNFEEFQTKVSELNDDMGGVLIFIEEACKVSDFLKQAVDKNHEIFEMIETARKHPNDVVYGEFNYYTQNDS